MRSLEGMSILITGGGSGIGADCARRFCHQGARVTISGRRLEKLEAVQTELGDLCQVIQGDVTAEADRARMLETALEHGNGKLDALVNNAANMYRQPVEGYTEAFLQDAFNTNVISAMMLSSMAVPHLESTQGAIVFVGSTHTRRAFPGASPYATTKASAGRRHQSHGSGIGAKTDSCRLYFAGGGIDRAEPEGRSLYRGTSQRPLRRRSRPPCPRPHRHRHGSR